MLMKKIDLRKDGSLSVPDSKRITLLAKQVALEYNDYILQVIRSNDVEGFTSLLSVVCRNTYVSLIYDRMCRLALLEDRLKSGELFISVTLDSYTMTEPVEQLLKRYDSKAVIIVSNVPCSRRFASMYTFFSLLKTMYKCVNLWGWSRLVKCRKHPVGSIYILDTFIFKNSIDSTLMFNDRYYNGLIENIDISTRERTWYIPTLFGFRYPWEWMRLFARVSKSGHNIFLKEHWLRVSDYFFSIWKSLILGRSIRQFPSWRGLDISCLVKEEVTIERGSFSLTQSLLIYRFFMRLKSNGVEIDGVIDWFENQNVDRALCLGIRAFYPETKIKGYIGFVPQEFYLGMFPVGYEFTGGVLPDEIMVIGNVFVPQIKKFFPELNVSVAPAFRFQNIISDSINKKSDNKIILLAMPMILSEAKMIVRLARNVRCDTNFRWIIKIHPTVSRKVFQHMVPDSLDMKFEFTEEVMPTLLQRTHLLISSASSVTLEAVVHRVPVVILGSRSGPTNNPLEDIVDNAYWSICYTCEDLVSAIHQDIIGGPLGVAEYFSEITSMNVKKMMSF